MMKPNLPKSHYPLSQDSKKDTRILHLLHMYVRIHSLANA